MKKVITIIGIFGLILVQAQVGINTDSPKATLDVKKNPNLEKTIPQGFILPKLTTAERSNFTNVEEGMTIYNLDKKCIEIYTGVQNGIAHWNCMPNTASTSAQSITVSPAGFEGAYMPSEEMTAANKVKFKLKNNSFTKIDNANFSDAVSLIQNVARQNISVLPDQNNAVSLAPGDSIILSYTLRGKAMKGILRATFDKLGLQTDQSTQIGVSTANIANKTVYILSMVAGSTTIQGKINNGDQKLTIEIPYTQGQGSYNAYTRTKTVVDQNGNTRNLTLNIPAGNFGVDGNLTATITVDNEYLVKPMNPEAEYIIATFPISMGGSTSNVEVKGIGGIPDRNFGNGTHDFVYLPVEVTGTHNVNGQPYKKTWLNLNLGAEYGKVSSKNFNVFVNKTGSATRSDAKALGSLFQWQRKADGHEFRNAPTTTNLATSWTNSHPDWDGKFIITKPSTDYNWVRNGSNNNDINDPDLKLWQAGGANNPCPAGYHVPTLDEWVELHTAITGLQYDNDGSTFFTEQSVLPNLAGGGYRHHRNGWMEGGGYYANYWSSTADFESAAFGYRGARRFYFYPGLSNPLNGGYRQFGFGVRCIKN